MIAIERVERVEVFVNKAGTITIQQGDDGDEAIIAIPVQHIDALIEALVAAVDEAQADAEG